MKKIIKSYSDTLPKKIQKKVRCQHLDDHGNRCKKIAVIEDSFHIEIPDNWEDSEIYNYENSWVVVVVCEEHKFKYKHLPANENHF